MYTAECHQNVFDMKYNFKYQKGFKFGAAVTSLGMYYTSNKICPRTAQAGWWNIPNQSQPNPVREEMGHSVRGHILLLV